MLSALQLQQLLSVFPEHEQTTQAKAQENIKALDPQLVKLIEQHYQNGLNNLKSQSNSLYSQFKEVGSIPSERDRLLKESIALNDVTQNYIDKNSTLRGKIDTFLMTNKDAIIKGLAPTKPQNTDTTVKY